MSRCYWFRCILLLTIFAFGTRVSGAEEKKIAVPLFLFSGQSNMVCLGSAVKDLPSEDQKMEFENIKIHNRSDNAKSGWETLKPGFGADAQHFGVELYFAKTLAEAMPDVKMAFIKDASSGTYLGQSSGWLPPSSGGPGTLYKNMMDHIDKALAAFNDAFDTSEYEPRWAGFIWHQGEFDAWQDQGLANKYEENLTNLISDIREKAEDDSMPAIIPMINQSSSNMWKHISIVNAAEVAVAEKLVNCDTTQLTEYKLSDGIHYDAASMARMSTNCGERWLAMEFCEDWWKVDTVMVHRSLPTVSQAAFVPISGSAYFDLQGRKINVGPASFSVGAHNRKSLPIMMIQSSVSRSGNRNSKVLHLK